jgi:hypothetical protein
MTMATAPAPPPTAVLDVNAVTAAYIKIRDARTDAKRVFEAEDDRLKAAQERLESVLLSHLNIHGMETVRTEAGTFYKQEEIKPSCADWTAYYAWIKENDAFDGLEKRVGKTFIKDFMEAHDGMLPPGVSVHRESVVRVRRPSSK